MKRKSRDLVAPEEPLSFQCLVWNIEEPEVIIAALKDHTHVFCRKPCSLGRNVFQVRKNYLMFSQLMYEVHKIQEGRRFSERTEKSELPVQ